MVLILIFFSLASARICSRWHCDLPPISQASTHPNPRLGSSRNNDLDRVYSSGTLLYGLQNAIIVLFLFVTIDNRFERWRAPQAHGQHSSASSAGTLACVLFRLSRTAHLRASRELKRANSRSATICTFMQLQTPIFTSSVF